MFRFAYVTWAVGAGLILLAGALLSPARSAPPVSTRPATAVQVINGTDQAVPVSLVDPRVTIANAPEAPVPVVDAGFLAEPARHEFAAQAGGGNLLTTNMIAVPAGKRLVIEDLSAKAYLQPGETVEINFRIGTFDRYLPTLPAGIIVNREKHVAGEQVRLVADAGELVFFECIRSGSNGDHRLEASLSGFLIPAP